MAHIHGVKEVVHSFLRYLHDIDRAYREPPHSPVGRALLPIGGCKIKMNINLMKHDCEHDASIAAWRSIANQPRPKPPTYPPRDQQQQTSSQALETPPSIATGDVTGSEEPTSASLQERKTENDTEDETEDEDQDGVRMPRSVQAIYLKPLRRTAKYNLPVCDLQIRSYSVLNVEFMADFALRAAYFLHLPARGPVPLPRITERWTVPRSHFVHKKSQENFERITMRRLIQIHDGHPETVQLWLAFIRKHSYYGVGMKANVWEYEKLGVGKTMDVSLENLKKTLEPKWAHFGRRKNLDTSEKVYQMMTSDTFRQTSDAPLRDDGITPQT
ncbi:MAG: hypothetical protein Q9191_001855 [Dirinaria sp. TL-2023a]